MGKRRFKLIVMGEDGSIQTRPALTVTAQGAVNRDLHAALVLFVELRKALQAAGVDLAAPMDIDRDGQLWVNGRLM